MFFLNLLISAITREERTISNAEVPLLPDPPLSLAVVKTEKSTESSAFSERFYLMRRLVVLGVVFDQFIKGGKSLGFIIFL